MFLLNVPLAALVAALTLALTAPAAAGETDYLSGELIVRYEPGVDAAERIELRQDHDVRFERRLPLPGTIDLVRLEPGAESVPETAAELELEPGVAYAEPNFRYRAAASANDTWFDRLWGLHNTGQTVNGVAGTADADIDALEAWDVTTGSASVTVAVVDSGLAQDHPDLAPNLYSNSVEAEGTSGVDDDGNGLIDDLHGWDWVPVVDDNDPRDENGHGTHVAGILGARGNDGTGVAGVSWDSKVLPLRILDAAGSGSGANLVAALAYAGEREAQVVNASLGGAGFSRAVYDAIASAPNTLFVVAAGNGGVDEVGDDNDSGDPVTTTYPCADPPASEGLAPLANLVCVAATDQSDNLLSFSNYGATTVDLAAPGANIWSAQPTEINPAQFSFKKGTSMATPFVSGVAALLWARTPSATAAYVRDALIQSVDAKDSLTGKVASGGRLNALRALGTEPPVQQAAPPPSPPAAEPAASSPTPAPVAQAPAPKPSTPPADIRAPVAQVFARPRHRLGTVLGSGLPVTCQANEAGNCSMTLSVDQATARRLGIRVRRGFTRVTIGRATVRLGANAARTVRLRLLPSVRSALGRLARTGGGPSRFGAALETTVADVASNATTRRRHLTFVATRPASRSTR